MRDEFVYLSSSLSNNSKTTQQFRNDCVYLGDASMPEATSWEVKLTPSSREKTSSFMAARKIAEYQKFRANSLTRSTSRSTTELDWSFIFVISPRLS